MGVFDAVTKSKVTAFTMTNATGKNVNTVNYDCVKAPSGVCVVEYTYKKTIVVNPGTNGLIIAHQLCCRNGGTIKNLINPGETGSTYWCYIPPTTIANSSPRFKNLPPVYICKDAPLEVDYSATDPDGDSLVYSFYTPYIGASADNPKPNEPTSPNYNPVLWRAGFNTSNQVPGNPSMFINSSTGLYTLTPNTIGTYTIGVKVTEYRNGFKISSTFRDYQFNVINCEFDVIANYDIPGATAVGGSYSFGCEDTVCFRNKSFSKGPATYFWDFGDPSTTDDTSTAINPCWVFPGNGNYTVTLTVTSSICENEYKYDVRIRSNKPFDLGPDKIFCGDFLQTLDTKTPDAISVNWSNGQKGSRIFVQDTGIYIADVSYGKCSYSDTIQLIYKKVPEFNLPQDTLVCGDVDILLDVGVSGLKYQWSSAFKDKGQTLRVTSSGIYSVVVGNNYCTERDTIRVWQPSDPAIDDVFYCNDFNHVVDVGEIEEASYLWSNGATANSTTYTTGGEQWVRVTQRYCINGDSFNITNPIINLELGEDEHFCDNLNVRMDGGPDGISYNWSNGSTSRVINVSTPGKYIVEVQDAYGCLKSDSVTFTLSISPSIYIGEDTSICVNSPTTINAPEGFETYQWSTGSGESSITTTLEGGYKVTVTDEFGCMGDDSLYVKLDPEALPNNLYVPNAFTPNADALNDYFPYTLPVLQPGYFLIIYTRWGEKVFDSRESINTSWDGYYMGKRVPAETYMYYMYYRGCDGNSRNKKGTINVLY
ncbi:MAG: hypothetical protein COA58_12815 [Bacteroidetes bacterium]|nr:MAG: hypothetical protein COA58_12815 [Bacteroidota bacterium]